MPSLAWACFPAIVCLSAVAVSARGAETLSDTPSWQPPPVEEVRKQVFAWLDARQVDEGIRTKAAELWPVDSPQPSGDDLLARLAQTIALADENARSLVDLCASPRTDLVPPSPAWLSDPLHQTPPLVAANLRLVYGRWLVQESLFDEAREQIAGLRPEDVVDPASLLFCQGVVYHQLLDKEAGMKAVKQLLTGVEQSPRRYAAVARLIEADLKGLKPDSLDHIARRMGDVRRRLDLGRAGQKVRTIEDGVIESLDKLIKKLQEQQQQQSTADAGNLQPGRPAEESRVMGGKGRGEVTKRDVGSESGWGDLPPKEREEAMQQIGREFPSHYRGAIEQYFRKLAGEGSR
ncbi:MAG: hypothetical protein ABIK89_08605 [Planctomycetota bacterium]